jgi:type II secretory pathway predicted ATPase ExeA
MNRKMLAVYSLKYNPFSPEIPTQGLFVSPPVENFCWRVEHQLAEGGFAQVLGDPGTGKSAVLRIATARLAGLRDVTVGILTRPQASVADFYRELGALFGVTLSPHNRWAGAKVLREKWQSHIETSLYRPVLVIDDAQDMNTAVLAELRLLSSADLDSRSILTIILAGDIRLADRLQTPDLLPIGSRIRTRLRTEYITPQKLRESLLHVLKNAGNPSLMTPELMSALSEHAAGNYRALMNMANEMLAAALRDERAQLDEKLFFEVFAIDPKPARKRTPS